MNISIPSILLSLGGKCLLGWALLFLQRDHICRSFVGVFSVSLTVIDTALTLTFIAIHIHTDGEVFLLDLQLTRYHMCLLVQILGQVHSALHWPVVVVASLDHFCNISAPAASRENWIVHSAVTILLWYLATLYVFLLSDFAPVLEDVPHHQMHKCWVFHNTQILQVATLLFLALGYAALHAVCSTQLLQSPPLRNPIKDGGRTRSDTSVIGQALLIFLDTWAIFLIFPAVLLLLPMELPSYLGLNVAWLCFINSFLIAVVIYVACPTLHSAQHLPHDSFCEWRVRFSLAAEEQTHNSQ